MVHEHEFRQVGSFEVLCKETGEKTKANIIERLTVRGNIVSIAVRLDDGTLLNPTGIGHYRSAFPGFNYHSDGTEASRLEILGS
jgi:hypothetical protein